MKSSEWYNRLWKKKFDELPVKRQAAENWSSMHSLLDQHMPVSATTGVGSGAKTFIKKLISVVQYVVPAAAMIAGGIYVIQKPKERPAAATSTPKIRQNVTDGIVPSLHMDSPSTEAIQTETTRADTGGVRKYTEFTIEAPTKIAAKPIHAVSGSDEKRLSLKSSRVASAKAQPVVQSAAEPGKEQTDAVAVNSGSPSAHPTGEEARQKVSKRKRQKQRGGIWEWLFGIGRRSKPWKPYQPESPTYERNWGLVAVSNLNGNGASVFPGVFVQLPIGRSLGVDLELNALNKASISGAYSHPSFTRPDTVFFQISDSRAISRVELPASISYQIGRSLKLKAGPVLSYAYSQSDIKNSLGPVYDIRDTLFKSQHIKRSLNESVLTNRFNIGISAGIEYHYKRLVLGGGYTRSIVPYVIRTDLGIYKRPAGALQLRVGFKL